MAASGRRPVLIAGGGIGGLSLALALARLGLPSRVVERRAEWSEAGAGIQISPNGVHVLERLGVADMLAPSAGMPEAIVVRDGRTGASLQRLPLGDWIRERHGAPYWLAHRQDLQAVLLDAVRRESLVALQPGFEVASYAENAAGIHLQSAAGDSIEGSCLVGADGVFSRIRQQLFAPKAPAFSGWTACRTVVRADRFAPGGPVDRTATGVWLAPRAHVVHYPVRAGTEIAFVVVRAERWHEQGWSSQVAESDVAAALRHSAPALAEAMPSGNDWRRWALFEFASLPAWSKGRVTLLGDAAHPTLPFLAQGGVLALEDAATLAARLSAAPDDASISGAVAAYSAERAGRAARVVATARRNGTIFHLSGPAAFARNLAMRAISGDRVLAAYDWVYGWRPGEIPPRSGAQSS